MRTNLPVTQNEYRVPSGNTLVSTTDTKGRILYCNPMFIEVSGYSKEELLGQPHNLVRHPDMPEEAYRDMWQTIQSGRPWSAPVKNRRKNGDYYWVIANATPMLEDGQPIGYMSVRTEATREQIQQAEALYAAMRAEKARGRLVHTFKNGRLVKRTLLGRIREMLRFTLTTKIFLVILGVGIANTIITTLMPTGIPMAGLLNFLAKLPMLFVGLYYLRSEAVKPLAALIQISNRLAAGDLTQGVKVTRDDQMGDLQQALSQLSTNILSIVRDARQSTLEMQHGTQEIAQGNLDLSNRTEVQAGNLEKTATAMEEITGAVRQTASSAEEASRLATQVNGVAERSSAAVTELSSTMREIQTSSSRIGEITQVIDGIAFQTNILALNAAVEAARAGEQGRGFAVVATEVRVLAQRTSTAAKEIKQLIDESAAKVQQGQTRTDAVQTTLNETVSGIHKVSALVSEISTATNEQLTGISEINTAIAELDSITQQNAALVEEISASANALRGVAEQVTETVDVFRVESGKGKPRDAVELRRAMRDTAPASALLAVEAPKTSKKAA
jgi:aerotaxis receptor